MRLRTTTALVAAVAVAGGAAAAFGHSGRAAVTVKASEIEWAIKPTPGRAKHGSVTFVVKNKGKLSHEFIVVRSNRAPGKLPVKGTKAVLKGVKVIGKIKPFKAGTTRKLTVKLPAGKYILLCNLASHYKAGQYGGFRAT
jgi:uncharacterized cupredoxin-like copper-binding protein